MDNEDMSKIHVEVPYDTKGSPDGLMTVVEPSLGDWVHGELPDREDVKHVEILVTRRLLEDAKETKSQYVADAIRKTGIHGLGD